MKVNEAVEVINGELASTPSISSFNGVATRIDEVKRGCLFVARNPDEIDGAVALGAYGVVYDKYVQMIDGEIAWIKVSSIYDAMIRLIRYKLLREKIEVFFTSEVEYQIAHQINIDESIGFFDQDLSEFLSFMAKNPDIRGIVIKDKTLLDLALEYVQAIVPQNYPFDVLVGTLFDVKISYKISQYNLKLPSLFLPELASVIDLFMSNKIAFDLRNFSSISYMQPNFINIRAKLVQYGQTDRVVITEKDIERFKKYTTYIAMHAKWGKLILLLPKGYEGVFDMVAQNEIYKDKTDLDHLLKTQNYNFALVFGMDNAALIDLLTTPYLDPVLPLF
ncbi:hypothetical protein [Helicobacter cappadocius]|uniref:Ferrochelatase n=1 Tax=Helicobacter cappadocius TaxID=3063998 RepID=A0AA90Q1A0_9HELI|nr:MULTISPECIES: hypothetical protein [unclassified Helicobacter]MDO7252436.1 hypothetical protein [Helicobacter sp. faydin-H75]MDP2538303.1 hypothetical protein [Helicobacter sp. faydin-H76]